jgi:hypothetical protein
MNWLAMGRRLVDGVDGARNGWLTVLAALLACPAGAYEFDGSMSLELSGGNKTLSASLLGDWGIVPDLLYLVTSFGAVKQQPDPNTTSSPSLIFGTGLDLVPSEHWNASLNVSFSPKATDTAAINAFTIVSTRRSAQGLLALAYQSAGTDNFEWGWELGGLGAWYELSSKLLKEVNATTTNLFLVQPSASVTATLFTSNELRLRGSYVWYSTDPTTAGGFDVHLPPALQRAAALDQLVQARLAQLEANANFSAAPPWFDVKAIFTHRFGTKVTARFWYQFTRYVDGLGNAHTVGSKWTWKVKGWLRLWVGLTIQYDQLSTQPSFFSGYGTLGGELATE